jgi:hypothetical protein
MRSSSSCGGTEIWVDIGKLLETSRAGVSARINLFTRHLFEIMLLILLFEHDLFVKPVSTFPDHALVFFDPDHLRPATDHLVALHRGQRPIHRILAGRIGDQDDRHR